MKVTLSRNLGVPLLKTLGIVGDKPEAKVISEKLAEFSEGATVDVSGSVAEALSKRGLINTDAVQGVAKAPAITGVPTPANPSTADEKSDVADLNVTDATDAISRMRSKEKLQSIADTDKRSTVQQAAKDRLAAL